MSVVEPVFRWPPPGLERLQGDLWRVVTRSALAGVFLTLPLLFATTGGWDFSTLGPFADAWWVTLALASVGLAFAIDALVRVARLLGRAARAVERGYDPATVLHVLADVRSDMGFLIRGARHFSVMDEEERRALGTLRLLTPVLHAAAGLWLCLALAVGLVLAARGWLTPSLLQLVTLVPAGIGYLFGAVTGLTEDARVRRARRTWHARSWADDLDPERIESWHAEAGSAISAESERLRAARRLRRFSFGALAAVVVVLVPVLVLLPASAVGPVLTRMTVPPFEATQRRAGGLEAYRAFRVPHDPAVTPGEAGRLLQTLAYVGNEQPVPSGELEPPVRIPDPWLPERETGGPGGLAAHAWHEGLFEAVAQGASGELRAYLQQVADHPSRRDFSRLARAEHLDAAAGRWQDPLPRGMTLATIPVPRLGTLRDGARAHLAAAGAALAAGRDDEAELLVREILSVGFLLADDGPTLMENLVGQALVQEGGSALDHLYRVTGRTERAAELERAREAAVRAAERAHRSRPGSAEGLLRTLPALVLDSTTVRGLAWENFTLLATLAPCANLSRVVFGPDPAYGDFVAEARRRLVRWPSEESLFELASDGFVGGEEDGGLPGIGGLLTLPVRSGSEGCAPLLRRLGTLRERY